MSTGCSGSASGQGRAQRSAPQPFAGRPGSAWLLPEHRVSVPGWLLPRTISQQVSRETARYDAAMTDWRAARAALIERYGKPVMVDAAAALASVPNPDELTPAEVVAFRYACRAAADAWSQLNFAHYGHEPVAFYPAELNSTEVIGVMSPRAQLAALQAAHDSQR